MGKGHVVTAARTSESYEADQPGNEETRGMIRKHRAMDRRKWNLRWNARCVGDVMMRGYRWCRGDQGSKTGRGRGARSQDEG